MIDFQLMTDPFLLEALSMGVILKGQSQDVKQTTQSNVDVTVSPILSVSQGITEAIETPPNPIKPQELLSLVSSLPPAPTRFAQPKDMEPDKTTGVLLLAGLGLVVWKFKKGRA